MLTNWVMDIRLYWAVKNTIRKQDMYRLIALVSSRLLRYQVKTLWLACDKYIHMSSTAVYEPKHMDTVESDFDGTSKKLVWCDRGDFSYDEVKRQAECALRQVYADRN